MGISLGQPNTYTEEPLPSKPQEKRKLSRRDYGTINGEDLGNTFNCPTCQGTGRIPRGQESQLVAVIPCSDQRLKPRRTKLYVFLSVVLCLLVCMLVLFFLFPRSVSLSSVAVQSVLVYFSPTAVNMTITNVLNITNENFAIVEAHNLVLQALIADTIVGQTKIANVTTVKPRFQKAYTYVINVSIDDAGMNTYCKSTSIRIHTLFLHLQMTMTVFYLSHSEQLSLDTFEYIDCGTNTTVPHIM